MKKALITGGAGFIGSHLVDALIASSVSVTVIDKQKPTKQNKNPKAKYVKLNIQDPKTISVIKREKPDVIFHLAAHIDDRASVTEPVENAQDNIIGSLNVFEGAKEAGTKRIIFTSTGILYGKQKTFPVKESVDPAPLTPYAISKLAGERYLKFYREVHGITFAALRLGNVYGPRQDSSKESGAIGIFTSRLLDGESAFINNDGKTTRDYIYVGDVIDAIVRASKKTVSGIYNIGTGIQTSTKDLFSMTADVTGVKIAPTHRKEVKDVIKHMALNSAKAKRAFNWKAKMDIKNGIETTVEWYREHQ